MSESGYDVSISRLFGDLKAGRKEAADALWALYLDRLVPVAKRRLSAVPKRVADEEDVAVSVFKSLCAGAARGRFAEHLRREDLWRLLLHLTRQKSVDDIREQTRQKRGGGDVRGESVLADGSWSHPTPRDMINRRVSLDNDERSLSLDLGVT